MHNDFHKYGNVPWKRPEVYSWKWASEGCCLWVVKWWAAGCLKSLGKCGSWWTQVPGRGLLLCSVCVLLPGSLQLGADFCMFIQCVSQMKPLHKQTQKPVLLKLFPHMSISPFQNKCHSRTERTLLSVYICLCDLSQMPMFRIRLETRTWSFVCFPSSL